MDEQAHQIERPWLNSDNLQALVDDLRSAGYNVGGQHYVAVHDLVLALLARGERIEHPERLQSFLGPLVCSTPAEQADFPQHFCRWLQRLGYNISQDRRDDFRLQTLEQELKSIEWQATWWYRGTRVVIIMVLMAFVSYIDNLAISYSPEEPSIVPTPPGEEPPLSPTPTPTQATPEPQPTATRLPENTRWFILNPALLISWRTFLATLCLLAAFWLFRRQWWLHRAHLYLERHSTTQQPQIEQITVKGADEWLFPAVLYAHVAQNLRRRRESPSRELDVNATVLSTVQNGGWFTPKFIHRQVLPEYLLLIDRAGFRDHQARFVDELVARLRQNDLFITVFYFDSDPRICFPDRHDDPPLKLQELSFRYSDHRLVIFSDGHSFFDPSFGELKPWVNTFTFWSERSLVTPEEQHEWGYTEHELAVHFAVLPANAAGLLALVQHTSTDPLSNGTAEIAVAPFPEELRLRPHRWLERAAPEPEQISTVLAAVRHYLGEAGYYWLCACAIYPTLDWNITLYLGSALHWGDDQRLIHPARLLKLARLPWLRYGYMPDWLRIRLITALQSEQEQQVRSSLGILLVTLLEGPVDGFQLTVAREYSNSIRRLVQPLLRLLSLRAAQGSPLRDHVFLRFMSGRQTQPLLVRLPPILNQPFTIPQADSRSVDQRFELLLVGILLVAAVALLRWPPSQPLINPPDEAVYVRIPAGELQMGTSDDQLRQLVPLCESQTTLNCKSLYAREVPQHPVAIQTFWIMQTEVTNAQYLLCYDQGKGPCTEPGSGNTTWQDPDFAAYPITHVNWEQARIYAAWAGGRLPTEAEWEMACRSTDDRLYPWGNELPTRKQANYAWNGTQQAAQPVGSYPAGANELFDMAGNVWEWTSTLYTENYEAQQTEEGRETLEITDDAGARVKRGGSLAELGLHIRCAYRSANSPKGIDAQVGGIGFRVARDAP